MGGGRGASLVRECSSAGMGTSKKGLLIFSLIGLSLAKEAFPEGQGIVAGILRLSPLETVMDYNKLLELLIIDRRLGKITEAEYSQKAEALLQGAEAEGKKLSLPNKKKELPQ